MLSCYDAIMVEIANEKTLVSRSLKRLSATPNEVIAVYALFKQASTSIDVSIAGNFTVVAISMPIKHAVGLGASKMMPDDLYDPNIGYNIALSRAYDDLCSKLLKNLSSNKAGAKNE